MRGRNWAVFIGINIVISAAVVLTILFVWEHLRARPAPAPPSDGDAPTAEGALLATPLALTETPGAVIYIVQAGDTLSGIAQRYGVTLESLMIANRLVDPNVLYVGQALLIPLGPPPTIPAETPPPAPAEDTSVTPPPTLTPSGPPAVEIWQVLGAGDLATEVVIIRNRGGAASLGGWTLADAEGNVYTFPLLTLFTDAQVRLRSAAGRSTPSDLFWGRAAPAWNSGELITLRNAAGEPVDSYVVP